MELTPEFVCELPVHAASGLVIHGGKFFMVSDDEVHLISGTPETGFTPYKLWEEILPEEPKARKKVKPDFETLYLSGNELHILPSLSRPNRTRGAVVQLDPSGTILSHKVTSHSELLAQLGTLVSDINIEGAVTIGEKLHLFQRGNGPQGTNSVIIITGEKILVRPLVLPEIRGVPLTITDAAFNRNELRFLAVAEDTLSTYDDGAVLACGIGTLNEAFEVTSFHYLRMNGKPEGLAFDEKGTAWMVTDDDSREKPSRLFRYGF